MVLCFRSGLKECAIIWKQNFYAWDNYSATSKPHSVDENRWTTYIFYVFILHNSFIFLGKYKWWYRLPSLYQLRPWRFAVSEESPFWIWSKCVKVVLGSVPILSIEQWPKRDNKATAHHDCMRKRFRVSASLSFLPGSAKPAQLSCEKLADAGKR